MGKEKSDTEDKDLVVSSDEVMTGGEVGGEVDELPEE
jgi:hypothetical protein